MKSSGRKYQRGRGPTLAVAQAAPRNVYDDVDEEEDEEQGVRERSEVVASNAGHAKAICLVLVSTVLLIGVIAGLFIYTRKSDQSIQDTVTSIHHRVSRLDLASDNVTIIEGPIGPNGTVGATGPAGPQGEAGVAGAVGPTGPQGEVGPQGPQGIPGTNGTAGAVGATGPQGLQGEVGPQGPQGIAGTNGTAGAVGATGPTGADGPAGPTCGVSCSEFTVDEGTGTNYAMKSSTTKFQVVRNTTDLVLESTPSLALWVNGSVTATGTVTGNAATFTSTSGGTMMGSSLNVGAGTVTGGALSATTGSFSSTLSATAITGTSLSAGSGTVGGGAATFTSMTAGSGAVSGGAATFTSTAGGTITGSSLNVGAGSIDGGAATFTSVAGGAITGSSLNVGAGGITGGALSATTGTFSSTLSATAITGTSLTAGSGAVSGGAATFTSVSGGTMTGSSLNVGAGSITGGALSATTGVFSSTLSATAITGTSLSAGSGAVGGGAATFTSMTAGSGAVSGGAATFTSVAGGTITGSSLNVGAGGITGGALSATTGVFSSTLSATAITGTSLSAGSGTVGGGAATFTSMTAGSGAVSGGAATFTSTSSGPLSATTGTFSSTLGVTGVATFATNVIAGGGSAYARLQVTGGGIALNSNLSDTSFRPAGSSGVLPGEIRGHSATSVGLDDGFLRLSAGGGAFVSAQSSIDLTGQSGPVLDMDRTIVMRTANTERLRINSAGTVSVTGAFSGTTITGTGAVFTSLTTGSGTITGGDGTFSGNVIAGFVSGTPNARLQVVGGGVALNSLVSTGTARPALGTTVRAGEIRGHSNTFENDAGFLRLSAGGGLDTTNQTSIDLVGRSTDTDMDKTMVFRTAGTERMRIEKNGNVGIAKSTPFYPLHVSGTTYNASGNAVVTAAIMVESDSAGSARVVILSAGAAPVFGAYHTGGTLASPTATPSGSTIAYFLGGGLDGSGVYSYNGGMQVESTAAWSNSSSRPTRLYFMTTPATSGTRVERMRIDENGNFIFGSSAVYNSYPYSFYSLVSNRIAAFIQTLTGEATIELARTAGTLASWQWYIPSGSTNLQLWSGTAGSTGVRMSITATGFVGIGATPSTTWRLLVDGRIHAGDASDLTAYGQIQITRPAAQGTGFHLSFVRAGNTAFGMGFLSNSNTFGMHHGLDNTGSLGIFIDNTGNVGVGARAPGYKLTVVDTMQVTNAANDVMGLFSGTYGNYMMLGAWNAAGATSKNLVLNSLGGNICMGSNTACNNKVEVIGGGLRVQGAVSATASGVGVEIGYDGASGYVLGYNRATSTYRPMSLQGTDLTFITAGVTRATIDTSGHFVPGANNANNLGSSALKWKEVFAVAGAINTSDRRSKKNIRNSTLGLRFIRKLRPVNYQFKDTTSIQNRTVGNNTVSENVTQTDPKGYEGLIAQEVFETLTELNVTAVEFAGYYDPAATNETGELGLRYTEFVSPLIKAVQEVDQTVQTLDLRTTPVEGAPESSNSPCQPGQQRYTTEYLFTCVQPDQWGRSVLDFNW